MPNFPTNYIITEVTYNNVASGSTVATLHPTAVLLITPLTGYTLDSTQFSVQPPFPPNTTDVVFTQSGLNVICTVIFNPTFVMPASNVEIPLCITGVGELIQYIVDGYVYAIGDANVISTPVSGAGAPFSSAAPLNTTVTVYTGKFTCNTGYYMPIPPVVAQNAGNPTGFTITYNDTYNIGGLLIAREYVITYLMPSYDNLDNNFSITASSLEIYVPTIAITGYSLNTSTVLIAGEVRTITIFGSEGADWTLACPLPILQIGPPDPITNVIPYGTTVSGTIGVTGLATLLISIPASAVSVDYSITLSGDLIAGFSQPNPIVLHQFANITVTYALAPTAYFISNGDKYNVGRPFSVPLVGMDGYSNIFNWNIVPVSNYGMILVQQPTLPGFDNLSPIFNGGTNLAINTLTAAQPSGSLITLNATGAVITYGTNSFTSSLDLTKFIAYIDTTTPSSVSNSTANSGGIVGYTGAGGTLGIKGLCYSLTSNPTVADFILPASAGFGSFVSNITGLNPLTTYFVRAYAYNSSGTVFYGPEKTFTTLGPGGFAFDLCYNQTSSQLACDCPGCASPYNMYFIINENEFDVTVFYYDENGILQNGVGQQGPSTWCSIGAPYSEDEISVEFGDCDCVT